MAAPVVDRGRRIGGVTLGGLWGSLVAPEELSTLLSWPPDVFALVDRALDASEAYRFVVSPPTGLELESVADHAAAAARDWWSWLDRPDAGAPDALRRWWDVIERSTEVDIDQLATGTAWSVTTALLALYAIADEACAGLGSATAAPPGAGCSFRAGARELLAETGSLSRLPADALRVIPRCRASGGGMSIHSLSRHVSVRGPQVDLDWHRMLSMPSGVALPEEHANVLLLPWPLRVRARDFRSSGFSLPQMDAGHSGFFTFEPGEALDLSLVDRVIRAAIDEAGTVDAVFLPESAITPDDIGPLEALLGSHGVWCLVTGIREGPDARGLGANWVHVGIRHEQLWRHAVQHKHHRWSLDHRQIQQYHLGGALSPTMRWWEAISIPRRSLQVIDQGAVTIAALVCEDLARPEPVADLVRAVGPSLVVTLLLDGPQLASRWTARYASVLADDPGSAVLTLTSYGMVQRCRPPGCPPSRVVALWKDVTGELTEIELEEGAAGVLIATHVRIGDSGTADGRHHEGTTATLSLAAVTPIHTSPDQPTTTQPGSSELDGPLGPLDEAELSKATSWAEAIAEAAVADTDRLVELFDRATATDWRTALGLPEPTHLFLRSVDALRGALPAAPEVSDLLAATAVLRRSDDPASGVTATLVEIAIQQRVFAEVQAGRLDAGALALLAPR